MSGIPGGTADDVLIEIVEKVRGHFMHTGRGSGPTLVDVEMYQRYMIFWPFCNTFVSLFLE